jgi:predicted nucleotidyltransferase
MELQSVEAIVKALNDAGVEYIIVGGLAVNAHGYARMTRDVDLVLRLERDNVLHGIATLADLGYKMMVPVTAEDFADPVNRKQWQHEKHMMVIKLWSDVHQRTPIDIFIEEPFDFPAEARQLAWMELRPGLSAPVVSLETLLKMKADAGRPLDQIDILELNRIK